MYHKWYIYVGGVRNAESERLFAHFFATAGGSEPVRELLKDLDREDRRAIGADIATVEYGWPVGMPKCRSLGDGLWEVRTDLSGGRVARIVFCIHEAGMILLNGFMKKTRATPKSELDFAK